MKLQIGLVTQSLVWEQIFLQEGVPFDIVDLMAKDLREECSLLVVNRTLTGLEREKVEQYLRNGGAVLGYALHLFQVAGTNSLRERLDYIVSDHDEVFSDLHLIDLGIYGSVPREANRMRTHANTFAVFAGPLGGGFAVMLPFDAVEVLSDYRAASKNFYFTRDRLPSERVSLVSKGEVRHLLHRSFEYLHHVRGLPYAHLWYFPHGNSNLFAFRIDTDGASKNDVDELYSIARDNHVAMSWYLDVKSHQNWLDHFRYMVNQELGVHCYEHQTFPMYDTNLKNMSRAVRAMRAVGLRPVGFASPYGIWNPALAKAIDELSFEYSSEFSYAYDTLPLYPEADGKRWKTLQVPIHPICIGSMKQIGYSDEQMIDYYRRVLDLKMSRDEPLFFYHHPTHRSWDVVKFLFNFVKERNIENVTLCEYARWWSSRFRCRIRLNIDEDIISTKTEGSRYDNENEAMWLRLTRASGDSTVLPLTEKIDMSGVTEWKTPARMLPPEDVRGIREFDPRATLGSLYSTFKRKFE